MDAPNKRILTNEVRETPSPFDQFSRSPSSGISEDLILRLRSVGPRARKSVLEGYKTSPSFSKAHSTGNVIFKSMNDTLRDVYSTANTSVNTASNDHISQKRSRSVSDQDEREAIPENNDMSPNDRQLSRVIPTPGIAESVASRPMKALSRRALFATRSLPSGAFISASNQDIPVESSEKVDSEEDWSQENVLLSSEQPFEAMVL